jgi:hypothetical protein
MAKFNYLSFNIHLILYNKFPVIILLIASFSNAFFKLKKTAKGDYQLRQVCLFVRLSARKFPVPTGRIFVKSYIGDAS